MQVRRRVADALRLKQLAPGDLGRMKHLQGEVLGRGIEIALPRRRADLLRRGEPTCAAAAQAAERTQEEIANHEYEDAAETEAAGNQREQAAEPASAKAATAQTEAA